MRNKLFRFRIIYKRTLFTGKPVKPGSLVYCQIIDRVTSRQGRQRIIGLEGIFYFIVNKEFAVCKKKDSSFIIFHDLPDHENGNTDLYFPEFKITCIEYSN